MFTSYRERTRNLLSRRSRIFIGIHHTTVVLVVAWIGYLFYIRELV